MEKPNRKNRHVRLSAAQKLAAIQLHSQTGRVDQTAQAFGVSTRTMSTLLKSARSAAPQGAGAPDWRGSMAERAKDAVNRGLACPDDAYRAGSLGAVALKGLGEFDNGDRAGASVSVVFTSAMPSDAVASLEAFDIEAFPVLPEPPSDDDGDADD